MKNVILLASVIFFCTSSALAKSLQNTYFMTEVQDGRHIEDCFEIWDIKADLNSTNPVVQIQATSFVTHEEKTSVFPWLHESTSVSQVSPGIYKAELNGRLNPFSDLEVIIELSPDGNKIKTLSGSMRAGSHGQSVSVFMPDFKTPNKQLLITNPSYSYDNKED